jgi:hypothetical protein
MSNDATMIDTTIIDLAFLFCQSLMLHTTYYFYVTSYFYVTPFVTVIS